MPITDFTVFLANNQPPRVRLNIVYNQTDRNDPALSIFLIACLTSLFVVHQEQYTCSVLKPKISWTINLPFILSFVLRRFYFSGRDLT